MAFRLNHVHLKTPNPRQTADFYVTNLGATMEAELGTNGYRLDLHGLKLNITPLVAGQSRQQHYGIEHLALDTTDIEALVTTLKARGFPLLEEVVGADGRRVCFFAGPDGVQIEFIEMRG